ncbi:uncharacterized protein EV422DRAFT_271705 [Fimicolochytrium jonesii]|uniref:uncharacterized protein n=1 Tax=Fimicolochytrium jonesii TaxID=1396493 RepID=UPI0022FEBE0C|nr:uncharacterized protein EV422DRAFT_271705 [Fimicolochytrium jonesii]KAI8816839.1 hypothetical protein EV422DRAFT_271705 [Fimicolochytrium jonesii]
MLSTANDDDEEDTALLGHFSESATVTVKGRPCRLSVSGNILTPSSNNGGGGGGDLTVRLDCVESGEAWGAGFSPAALEDITKKTGNFKRYSVFLEMLVSSLKKPSQIVQLDFLTTSDLEALKKTQRGGADPLPGEPSAWKPSDAPDDKAWKKVYLILTYAVAFDRVHYPLPLPLISTPKTKRKPPDARIVALERENAELTAERARQMKEISSLLRENDKLKYKLKHVPRDRPSASTTARHDWTQELHALRVGTQRYLKDLERELLHFRKKHPGLQNSPQVLRIGDYLARLQSLIWLFLVFALLSRASLSRPSHTLTSLWIKGRHPTTTTLHHPHIKTQS